MAALSGIFRPELFSSSSLLERIRLDRDECGEVSSPKEVDDGFSYLKVVTDGSAVGDSVV